MINFKYHFTALKRADGPQNYTVCLSTLDKANKLWTSTSNPNLKFQVKLNPQINLV